MSAALHVNVRRVQQRNARSRQIGQEKRQLGSRQDDCFDSVSHALRIEQSQQRVTAASGERSVSNSFTYMSWMKACSSSRRGTTARPAFEMPARCRSPAAVI